MKKYFTNTIYILVISLLLTMLSAQSCSTVGYENVDTTRKAIIVANAEVRAANLLLQDLIVRDVISDEDAQVALQELRKAHGYLQAALDAITLSGDPIAAQSGLERATTTITVVLTLLSQFTGEP